jgi:hypothetical protein
MAAEKYMYGIKSVKFGTPTGSASMPAASGMTQWAQTVQGTLTLSEDEATEKEFFVEETTTPVHSIVTQAGALRVRWRAYDMTPSLIAVVKEGVAGTAGSGATYAQTYAGPVTIDSVEKALEITTTNDVVFSVYKAAVISRFDSVLGREQLLEMEVQATALDPGDGGSPYMISLPDPQS